MDKCGSGNEACARASVSTTTEISKTGAQLYKSVERMHMLISVIVLTGSFSCT